MEAHDILQYFRERQSLIVDAIREIVDIESPSHDSARSREVADWVEAEVRATGVDVSVERVFVADGNHLIIRAFPGPVLPTLLLGHTDTVHPVGTREKNPTRIEGDLMYGCGIFDMKANIVLMIEALRYFDVSGTEPTRPITILLSCDEEVGSHTGREFVEQEASASAACLVFEPSAEGRIKTGRKGTGQYTLRAHGLSAHAGLEPEKGANAVLEIAQQIPKIHSIENSKIGTTVNVCTVKGGTTSNVIPESAECEIDVRFGTMAEADRVDNAMHSLTPFNERVTLEVLGSINRPPLERTNDVAEFYRKARDIGTSFGYEVGETQVGGASDGNFVAALGIPILDGVGIAGDGAHMLTEHIHISDIANRATLVTLLLSDAV